MMLVFAGKQVGFDCLAFLVDGSFPVERVIAGTGDDTAIMRFCRERGIDAAVHDDGLQDRLCAEGRRWNWILSLWNPHILQPALLARADNTLNLHPALVPHCRGNDTTAWALAKGLPAGVSLLQMDAGIDTGDIWAQKEIAYPPLARGGDLFQVLHRELTDLFKASWPDIFAGRVMPRTQVGPVTSHTRKQTNRDRVKELAPDSAEALFIRWARAHDFSPRSTAEVSIGGKRYKVSIELEEIAAASPAGNRIGS